MKDSEMEDYTEEFKEERVHFPKVEEMAYEKDNNGMDLEQRRTTMDQKHHREFEVGQSEDTLREAYKIFEQQYHREFEVGSSASTSRQSGNGEQYHRMFEVGQSVNTLRQSGYTFEQQYNREFRVGQSQEVKQEEEILQWIEFEIRVDFETDEEERTRIRRYRNQLEQKRNREYRNKVMQLEEDRLVSKYGAAKFRKTNISEMQEEQHFINEKQMRTRKYRRKRIGRRSKGKKSTNVKGYLCNGLDKEQIAEIVQREEEKVFNLKRDREKSYQRKTRRKEMKRRFKRSKKRLLWKSMRAQVRHVILKEFLEAERKRLAQKRKSGMNKMNI